jgi:hypothetical protein
MFYYILHIFLGHSLAIAAALLTGFDPTFMFANTPPWEWPEGYGFGLPVVYAIWLGIVAVLYPVCRWYARVKRRSRTVLLSYL